MKKKIIIILGIMCLIGSIPTTKSIHVNLDDVYFTVGNEIYNCSDMDFNSIEIGSNYIVFNATGFYIDAPNDINITLFYLNSSMTGAEWDKLLNFSVNTSSGLVYFNISGFNIGSNYTVNRSNNWFTNDTSNATGFINWTYDSWDVDQYFEVFVKLGGTLFNLFPHTSKLLFPAVFLCMSPLIFLFALKKKRRNEKK